MLSELEIALVIVIVLILILLVWKWHESHRNRCLSACGSRKHSHGNPYNWVKYGPGISPNGCPMRRSRGYSPLNPDLSLGSRNAERDGYGEMEGEGFKGIPLMRSHTDASSAAARAYAASQESFVSPADAVNSSGATNDPSTSLTDDGSYTDSQIQLAGLDASVVPSHQQWISETLHRTSGASVQSVNDHTTYVNPQRGLWHFPQMHLAKPEAGARQTTSDYPTQNPAGDRPSFSIDTSYVD